jgi:hypothetical protein
MATLEEKIELVENIKGKRYYNIRVYGYGAEHVYATISKEAYNFWKSIVDEHGDSDLLEYLLNAEDGQFNFEHIEKIPPEANFLADEDGACYSWYDMPNEFEHVHSASIDSASIDIDEVEDYDYNSRHIATVVQSEDISDWTNKVSEDTDYEVEILDCVDDVYPKQGSYIIQMLSMEKGTFFEGTVETVGDFDPKKLKIQYSETTNGEDVIRGMTYNDKEVYNEGGDTNGKGYSAAIWQQ